MMEFPILPETTHTICSSICQILQPGFGPNGLKTMLCSSTGKIHITNCSCTILASLALSHPIGTLISKSAQQFHSQTGDSCSTFIIILQAFFSQLRSLEASDLAGISLALAKIQNLILGDEIIPALLSSALIHVGYEDEMMLKLIRSSLGGRYPATTSQHFAQLICKMLPFDGSLKANVLNVLNNFRCLCHEDVGTPSLMSKVISGVCIRSQHPVAMVTSDVRFIVMDFDPNDSLESATCIETKDLGIFMKWERKVIKKLTEKFKMLELQLVLSTCPLSDSFRSGLLQEGIHVIHRIDESEAQLISSAFNIHALHSFNELDELESSKFIGCALSLQNFEINGRMNLILVTQTISSLIICAPTEGQTKQLMYDLQNTLKVILMWLDHDHVIPVNHAVANDNGGVAMPGGGAFEILISSLFKNSATNHMHDTYVCQTLNILHESFLSPPLLLLANSYASLKSLAHLKSKAAQFQNLAFVDGRNGRIEAATSNNGIMEPLAVKLCLLENILQLMRQVLRLHSMVNAQRIN